MKKFFSFITLFALVILLADCGSKELDIKVGRALSKPHGDKSFADIVVVLDGDEIIAVSLDEYQFGSKDDFKPVPNNVAASETHVLYSKRVNDDKYSDNMKRADSKQKLSESYDAIEDFAVGKTVEELKEFLDDNKSKNGEDLISGSTLVDTDGYLTEVYNVAKSAKSIGKIKADKDDIKVGRALSKPHGDKSFADIVVVRSGDLIIAVSLDEYQFGSKDDFKAVPNNVGGTETHVLYSKRVNDDKYSDNMKRAGSKQKLSKSYDAIEEFAFGKTVNELKEFLDDNKSKNGEDLINGSTLVDTDGYLTEVYNVAKNAK